MAGEIPSLTGESIGEAHRILENTQAHPCRNQHLKGHNPLVESEGSDRKWGRSQVIGIVPSLTPPLHTAPQHSKVGCWALANAKGPAAYNGTGALRQRSMAQINKQIKTPEKKLISDEISNLSDTEFKTLLIRMFTEMIEYGHKMKEEVKAIQNEIKENIQGTKSERKKTWTQINDLKHKEEINIQTE